jgi:hypothetical protein
MPHEVIHLVGDYNILAYFQAHLQRLDEDILHQAFEDGPDRGFRNVGKT